MSHKMVPDIVVMNGNRTWIFDATYQFVIVLLRIEFTQEEMIPAP